MQSFKLKSQKWYVLYTLPRAEKQVEMRIKETGTEVFLPLHKSPRRWSDRIKIVEIPLYSSYIFVNTSLENLYHLLKIPGIARIIYFCGEPAVVKPNEINAIRRFLLQTEGINYTFEMNDEIRIALGPFKDMCGKVKKIGKKYIVLTIDQIGVTVVARTDQVVKDKKIASDQHF